MQNIRKYMVITIVLVLFICIFLIMLFSQKKKPEEIIENNFSFSLPTTYKILNFNNNIFTGDFDAKILINEQDIEKIRKDTSNYFGDECNINDFNIPDLGKSISWWDVDQGHIISFYMSLIDGDTNSFLPVPKTIETWVFLVQQKDGKYYLYISRY